MVYFDWIIKHYEMKKYKTTQVENSKPGLTESADYEECTGPRGPGVTHPGIRPLWLFPTGEETRESATVRVGRRHFK